jgi:hypothetical protein
MVSARRAGGIADSRVTATMAALVAAVAGAAVTTGCDSFQDPNVVVDLRILAMASSPPDQLIDVDLTQPPSPQALLAQLLPSEVCALVADPALDRRLAWVLTLCTQVGGERCDENRPLTVLDEGLLDDPDTSAPAPRLCATVEPDAGLFNVLVDIVRGDALRGLGGIDYAVELRIGGEDASRELDQFASKTLRVVPRIPEARTANHNPSLVRFDASIDEAPPVPLPLGRCPDTTAPFPVAPGARVRLTPIELDGARETYVVPTLDGKSQMFTESWTYQWVASAGGFSSGSTGGPRDVSGNPAPLFTDFRAPRAEDLDGPTDISLWIVQRDERLGAAWYEACVRVTP